ncbi:TetR/AcrR family transcriptional regulator [Paenibacillus rigui]|uniref:TetR/AcrR family transcriptional regulator n=1 Tax=Paenibacillus rigui TaxID=554312 RepID=UPI0015C5F4A0|nr:TetR/AcrR family transcriptional regulator [Paenibacillus rigui]
MLKKANEEQAAQSYDERREQIKKAALKVFANRGIAGTKMSMIAAEAGISQGLSYRYFSSKEEIFTILVQEAMEQAESAIKNVGQLPGTPTEQLRALTINMLDPDHKLVFLLLQQARTSDDVPEKVRLLLEQYSPKSIIDQLIPTFVRGQQAEEFCIGDPYKLLFLYFTVITGLMLQDVQVEEDYWRKEVDQLMKLITN